MKYLLLLLFPFLTGFQRLPSGLDLIPRIHFMTDSFEILKEEEQKLDQNIEWLQKNPGAVLILEGHCDEWGKDSYNLELGDRRAREVKDYLFQKNIDPERIIMVVSYGEKKPLNGSHHREAWRENRRVEFVLR